jgi:hypothetical protein
MRRIVVNLALTEAHLSGTWPVHADYRIDGGYLVPAGAVRYSYHPEDESGLPFEIAKLAEAGAEDIRRFAQQRGLLGLGAASERREYDRFIDSAAPLGDEPPVVFTFAGEPGDLLDDVRKHARILDLCLNLYEGLSVRRGKRALTEALKSPAALQFLVGAPVIRPIARSADKATATAMLAFVISKYIEGVRPYSSETDGAVRYKFTALIEVAYLHLAWLREAKGQIGRCLQCGKVFAKRDARQRFCPPVRLGERESPCGQRYRYEQRRRKAKGGRR